MSASGDIDVGQGDQPAVSLVLDKVMNLLNIAFPENFLEPTAKCLWGGSGLQLLFVVTLHKSLITSSIKNITLAI